MKSELDTSTLSYRDKMAIEEYERLSPVYYMKLFDKTALKS